MLTDNFFVRSFLTRQLPSLGFPLTVTDRPDDVLPLLERLHPGLLLVDLGTGEGRGEQVCRSIGSRLATGTRLIVTAKGSEDEVEARARSLGALGFLAQPLTSRQIQAVLRPELPVLEVAAAVSSSPPPPSPGEDSAPVLSPPTTAPPSAIRILVVDDDPIVQVVIRDRLQGRGHQVVLAHDPGSFRDALLDGDYSLILLDVLLHGITGDRLVGMIDDLASEPYPRVLLHSSLPDSELAELAKRVGAAGWIAKSGDDSEFHRRIDEALGKTTGIDRPGEHA